MARRLKIKWATGESVTARLAMPSDPLPLGILLAHGAGAGQDHFFMAHLRAALAAHGFPTMTFNYAYSEAGRRAPDRLPKLLAVHRAAADRLASYVDSVALGGKSMGGRVGSHLAGDDGWPGAAMVYLGYPLVPMGKAEPRATDHLARISAPQLFLTGSRDALGPLNLTEPLVESLPHARLEVVERADHSFRVPKSVATQEETIASLAALTSGWLRSQS